MHAIDFSKQEWDGDGLSEPERKLTFSLKSYLRRPSEEAARTVVGSLQDLLNDPRCIGFPDYQCAYQKMLRYWKAKC